MISKQSNPNESSIDHSCTTRVGMATADKAKCFMVRMREN